MEKITFEDLYPQPGDFLLYYGPDILGFLKHANEYRVMACRQFPYGGVVFIESAEDGSPAWVPLSHFYLKEPHVNSAVTRTF